MTNDLNKDNEDSSSYISPSQVTPPKNSKAFIAKRFLSVSGVCLMLLIFAFLPKTAKTEVEKDEPINEEKELTLSQNLALIEKMRQQVQHIQVAQPVNSDVYPHKAIKPPKLRTKNGLSKEILTRMNAPTTFFNTTHQTTQSTTMTNSNHPSSLMTGNSPDAQFMNQQNEITSVTAKKLPHPYETVPAGEIISATLETAINSELPGMVRAITTRDIYSLEGQHCLVPRGSTLVGQFNSSVVEGQSRILVVWNRVQLANGVIVTLNSPGTDSIGRSGQGADYIDRHFFERFGTSALLSILGAYTATNGVGNQDEYNSKSQYRMAIASSFQQASGQTLQHDMQIKPTLQINQGTLINVFVAHDLDFHGVSTWE
jgi:type IV secretion system protein VirB10